jgi:hypothetical protein
MPFREGAGRPPVGSGGPFDWLIMAGFGVVVLLLPWRATGSATLGAPAAAAPIAAAMG